MIDTAVPVFGFLTSKCVSRILYPSVGGKRLLVLASAVGHNEVINEFA